MRVLLVSDLHYELRKFDWVLQRAASPEHDIDVVVVAGDLLDVASGVPLDTQIAVVLSYLERLARCAPTIVCSGNHDLDHRTDSGEKATRWLSEARDQGVHVDGDSFDHEGWRFTACAWWEGTDTLAALEERLRAASVGVPDRRWLWVFHGPPEGPLAWTGARHYGDPELPRLLDEHRPAVVLCGHIHQAPFTSEGAWAQQLGTTWLFNAGYQRGDRPTFIVLDLDGGGADGPARRASWWSMVDEGEIELAR